jgi:hypothetical protein
MKGNFMRSMMLLFLVCMMVFASANFDLTMKAEKPVYTADETIVLTTSYKEQAEDAVWGTYLFFMDGGRSPKYIVVGEENKLAPEALGMLPEKISLKTKNWRGMEEVRFFLCLCEEGTEKVLATASARVKIVAKPAPHHKGLPVAGQLLLVQEVASAEESAVRGYTDYKQFDSRWKNDPLGTSTIGAIGCAMTSAGNIISCTPRDLNNYLKSHGGYSGNLIIWSAVPGISYYGSGSISDGLFGSYHVIGCLGGHFILLTGVKSSGQYYSHDPGKSSNPVYSASQIKSVRLYRK